MYTLYERVCVRTVSEVLCIHCTRGSVYVLRGIVYVMYQRYCVGTYTRGSVHVLMGTVYVLRGSVNVIKGSVYVLY